MNGNGDCLFSAVRRGLKAPAQFTNTMLRRMIVSYMAVHAKEVFPRVRNDIKLTYGLVETPTETAIRIAAGGRKNPGPFSYVEYLHHMLRFREEGDQIVIFVLSIMWGLRISVYNVGIQQQIQYRHNCTLKYTDLVLVYNGISHYSAVGK